MQKKGCLYSQWFTGEENVVLDCLSRVFHLDDSTLTNLILLDVPEEVTFGFNLFTLPIEIKSWLTCLVWNQPCTEPWSKEPMRSKLSLGADINNTSCQSVLNQTGSLMNSPNIRNRESLEPLLPYLEKVDLVLKKMLLLNQKQFGLPWTALLRPLSWSTELTPGSTQTPNFHLFYTDNSELIQLQTHP
jgi:hypothetical protein